MSRPGVGFAWCCFLGIDLKIVNFITRSNQILALNYLPFCLIKSVLIGNSLWHIKRSSRLEISQSQHQEKYEDDNKNRPDNLTLMLPLVMAYRPFVKINLWFVYLALIEYFVHLICP